MARRTTLAALLSLTLLLGLLPAGAAADTPLPNSMAAVGDSITQAASTGGSLGTDYPQNSWSTGTSTTVNSHYLRLTARNPAMSDNATNLSVSGAKMVHLPAQMEQAAALAPDYVTVLIGGNDLCTDTEALMTEVPDFQTQFEAAMEAISASPGTTVYVVSIPRVLGLWELFRNNWWARLVWSAGNICQSLLANPTSTQTADVQRRARVAQRNVDFNDVLAAVCAEYANCHWDGLAAYNTAFATSDVSGDYFHPSTTGQAKLARVSWNAGPWVPPPSVSLGSLAGSASSRKGGWTARVTLSTVDGNGQPVPSAAVSGQWSTGVSGGCTTGSSGTCSFTLNLGRKVTSASWTIATITHATLPHVPNALTSVTIAAP